MNSGRGNPNYGKHNAIHSEEFKQKMRDNNPIKHRKTTCKGIKQNLTPEQRQARKDRIAKVNAKGFENKGGRCKFFNINDVVLQGRYELYYYLLHNKEPQKVTKSILTPYGWYRPDFEHNEQYVEIKSTYTIKTALKSGQLKKIAWVSRNIKAVKILVINETEVETFLNTYNGTRKTVGR